jgi:hypothetical protein
MKTGEWTTFDFVKYLASIQSSLNLTFQEIGRLRQTPAFLKEGAGKAQSTDTSPNVQRHKITDLYEPIDIFRELGLPIIEWGVNNPWRPESDEGKFLRWVAFEELSDSPIRQRISSFYWA